MHGLVKGGLRGGQGGARVQCTPKAAGGFDFKALFVAGLPLAGTSSAVGLGMAICTKFVFGRALVTSQQHISSTRRNS
jgi:hypothetical protein